MVKIVYKHRINYFSLLNAKKGVKNNKSEKCNDLLHFKFELPCYHEVCKNCFFENIKRKKYTRCNICFKLFNIKKLEEFEKKDNCHACYILGRMYHNGECVEKNITYAVDLYIKSSKNEDCDINVYNNLGMVFYFGSDDEVEKDFNISLKWYNKVLEYEPNDIESLNKIGKIYYLGGNGVTKDYMKSYKYYEIANNLYEMAYIQYSINNYEKSIEICNKINTDNISYYKSRELLGKIYYFGGNGIAKDYIESINKFKEALDSSDNNLVTSCKMYLNTLYKRIKNYEKAEEYE